MSQTRNKSTKTDVQHTIDTALDVLNSYDGEGQYTTRDDMQVSATERALRRRLRDAVDEVQHFRKIGDDDMLESCLDDVKSTMRKIRRLRGDGL